MRRSKKKLLAAVLVLTLLSFTALPRGGIAPTVFASDGADGRTAQYTFDGDAPLSNKAGIGTVALRGGAELGAGGRSGGYVRLDGSASSYLELPADTVAGFSECTFSAWVHSDAAASTWTRWLEMAGYNGSTPQTYISLQNRESGVTLAVSRNGVASQIVYESRATVAPGGWAHLALTIDAAGRYVLYINGAVAGEAQIGVGISQVRIENIYIGKSAFASDPYLSAYIDDVVVYDRALGHDEIASAAGITNETAVLADIGAVDIPSVAETARLSMPTQGNNGTTIAWTSSDENVISLSGNVFAVSEETVVTLRAVFTRGDVTVNKTYTVRVKPMAAQFAVQNTTASSVSLLPSGEIHDGKMLNKNYMLSLSVDRLLCNYRKTSGIPTSAQEYGGWITEANGGAGNIEAHYLSALVYLYAEEKDPVIEARIDEYLEIWQQCQTAYAERYPEQAGYFGGVNLSDKLASIEQHGSGWPLYYVIDKHICALYDAYVYLGKEKALEILRPYADCIANRVNGYDQATMDRVFRVEYGGISMALFKAYELLGESRYLSAALRFCEPSVYDTIEAGGDPFDWKHANTAIPKIYGAAWGYAVTGDARYLSIALRGFELLTVGRTFATGNVSEVEEYHPAHEIDTEGFQSCETCCAYNLMRLSDMLYRLTGKKSYMDYYEKLFYNCILSSIDPQTGMKTYYVSMDSGYYKVYHTAETSFWCCTGTGFENFTKLNQNIYYRTNDALIVNLFVPSRIVDEKTGLGLEQTTAFPNEKVTTLTVTQGADTTLKIRDPNWSRGTKISYNGKILQPEIDDEGYITVRRNFVAGDKIMLYFPMEFRLEALDSVTQAPVSAVMYGPLVMSGIIESIGEISPIQNNSHTGNTRDNKVRDELLYDGDDLFENVQKIGDLEYLLAAANQTVRLKAFYKCHRERYIIYWNIFKRGTDELSAYIDRENAEESYTKDSIDCGNWFSESPHGLQSNGSWVGNYATEHNRGLVQGGWFSYVMRVEKGVQNRLEIMHFGTDSGYSYSVWCNGKKIGTANVSAEGKKYYWKTFDIPLTHTANANSVTVKIVCDSGTLTTGIYTMRTVRCGLAEWRRETCDTASGDSVRIDTSGKLLDRIAVSGSGRVRLEGARNGAVELLYEGEVPTNVARFMQFDSVHLTALEPYRGEITVYGDEVTGVDEIRHTLAAEGDFYAPAQFATVQTASSGTVRLRIDYDGVTFSDGEATAKPYGTDLSVRLHVDVKDVSEGLSVYYDFENVADEIVPDVSGHDKAGTVRGGVTAARGRFGSGLDLGGIDGYIALPALDTVTELTMSMWVKFNRADNVQYQRLFDLGNDRKNYFTYTACGYAAGAENGTLSSVSDKVYEFSADAWYFYAVTLKDGMAVTYLNGVELSRSESFAYSLSNIGDYVSNYIGKAHIDYMPYLNAVIDEFRLYDYALSRDQIKGLYRLDDPAAVRFASADDTYTAIEETEPDITYDTPDGNGGGTGDPAAPKKRCGCGGNASATAAVLALGASAFLKKRWR